MIKNAKPGYCEDCKHDMDAYSSACTGCLGTWGETIEKPNWGPKDEDILKFGECTIPACRDCVHLEKSSFELPCKFCSGISDGPVGNFFVSATPDEEHVEEPISASCAEPVTSEEKTMSRTITNAMQLMRAGELQHMDTVVFGSEVFIVGVNYLSHVAYYNDRVFEMLGIDGNEKYKVASLAYGYRTSTGNWPEFNPHDFAAATRLVYMLYSLLDSKHKADVEQLQEYKHMLESYQQDEDDAAIKLEEAQRNYDYEKQAREQLEADMELLEKKMSK